MLLKAACVSLWRMPILKAVTARGFRSSFRHDAGQRADITLRHCDFSLQSVSCVQFVDLFPFDTVCDSLSREFDSSKKISQPFLLGVHDRSDSSESRDYVFVHVFGCVAYGNVR